MVYACCTPHELKERIFAESAAVGADYVRVDIQLADIFEEEGARPDWRGVDEVIALARRHRLKVLAILLHPPSWISTCPERPDHGRCAVADVHRFGELAGQVAAHAGDAIDHWEILNEPDGGWAFEGTPEQYARMLRAAHDGIKARAPGDQIVLGGLMRPHDPVWLARFLATPGADAAHSFDIANVHLRGPVSAVVRRYAEVRERLGAVAGFDGPLWVTEHGYPADPAFQVDPAYASGAASQADYLTQTLVGLGEAGAEQVFVTLRDQGAGEYATEGLASISEMAGHTVVRREAFAAVRRVVDLWPQLIEWRTEQREHERGAEALAAQAAASAPKTRRAATRLREVRSRLRADKDAANERALARAQARVAGARAGVAWQRAVLHDLRLRAGLHRHAAADLAAKIAG